VTLGQNTEKKKHLTILFKQRYLQFQAFRLRDTTMTPYVDEMKYKLPCTLNYNSTKDHKRIGEGDKNVTQG